MPIFFLILIIMAPCFASDLDKQMDLYIKQFNYQPLPDKPLRNFDLYKLGVRLFWEKQLSGNNNISCHDCHSVQSFSGDALPLGVGEGATGFGPARQQDQGVILARHTPVVYNLGLKGVNALFWDGRVKNHPMGGWLSPEEDLNGPNPQMADVASTLDSLLSVQALFPIASAEEMLGQGSRLTRQEAWSNALERLLKGPKSELYQKLFKQAYPNVQNYNIGHVANALAEFQRHFFAANNTPWDQYLKGKKEILSARMKRGAILFMSKATCSNCHTGEHLTSWGFQNACIPQIGPGANHGDDKGRMEVTQNEADLYRFRVSPLRNIALTAPYMHSGIFKTMWEVIDHYDHPHRSIRHLVWDEKHPQYREDLKADLDPARNMKRMQTMASNLPRRLMLTPEEKQDLYCFLMVGLTDMKLQDDLVKKGVLDALDDCSPVLNP